jgi:creatinine amidohydrolase
VTVRRLAELNWAELTEAAPRSIAILPIGSQEQHSAHLPLGTDTLLVEAALDRALTGFDGTDGPALIRLPTMPYGHSPHHLFRAAISLGPETLLRVLAEFLDSLHTCGFARVLIVNGHGGNTELLSVAVKQFALRAPVVAATCDYWDVAAGEDSDGVEDPGTTPGHAGRFETSLMLAAHPALVGDPSGQPAPDAPPLFDRPVHPGLTIAPSGEWARVGGLTDDPAAADAERGRALLGRRARGLARAIHAFDQATTHWTGTS